MKRLRRAHARHRRGDQVEARFYVSAGREFLDRPPDRLRASDAVARMLLGNHAQRLALDGVGSDPARTALERDREDARRRLAETDARLDTLHEEGARLLRTHLGGGRNGTLPRVKLGRHERFIHAHVEVAILDAEQRLAVLRSALDS